MTINKAEVITIPKWKLIVLIPILVSAVTGYATYKASSMRYEIKIQNLEEETDKKINKSEVDIQFTNVKTQLNRIEDKLDRNGRIIQEGNNNEN